MPLAGMPSRAEFTVVRSSHFEWSQGEAYEGQAGSYRENRGSGARTPPFSSVMPLWGPSLAQCLICAAKSDLCRQQSPAGTGVFIYAASLVLYHRHAIRA
jgi:hypothetical protein